MGDALQVVAKGFQIENGRGISVKGGCDHGDVLSLLVETVLKLFSFEISLWSAHRSVNQFSAAGGFFSIL
jgi:hypothetical protein